MTQREKKAVLQINRRPPMAEGEKCSNQGLSRVSRSHHRRKAQTTESERSQWPRRMRSMTSRLRESGVLYKVIRHRTSDRPGPVPLQCPEAGARGNKDGIIAVLGAVVQLPRERGLSRSRGRAAVAISRKVDKETDVAQGLEDFGWVNHPMRGQGESCPTCRYAQQT